MDVNERDSVFILMHSLPIYPDYTTYATKMQPLRQKNILYKFHAQQNNTTCHRRNMSFSNIGVKNLRCSRYI